MFLVCLALLGCEDVMLHVAYVLITTDPGHMGSVVQVLKKISGVEDAYMVYGVYDIVAKVGAENLTKLKETIQTIRREDKILSTLTMMVIEESK